MWIPYISFFASLISAFILGGLAVWFGYFVEPARNVQPLLGAAIVCALLSMLIGATLWDNDKKHK